MSQQNGSEPTQTPDLDRLQHRGNHFEELIEDGTEQTEEPARGTKNLLAKDFVLGNISKEDRRAWWWLAKNQQEFAKAEHPPKGSMLQGPIRAALLGDPMDRKEAMDPETMTDSHSELMMFEARASRSEAGFQQDKLVEQRQVHRKEDSRFENNDGQRNSDGLLGGLFS